MIFPLRWCLPTGLIRPLESARKRCLSDVTSLIAAGRPGRIWELGATVALGEMAGVVGGMAEVMPGTEGVAEMEVAPVHAALQRTTPTSILASIRFTGDVPLQLWRAFLEKTKRQRERFRSRR
jgi:hypothetical protein